MRFVNVLVIRDERLSMPRYVGAWEIPVLQVVHGVDKVEVNGKDFIDVDRELPDPTAEFDRLSRRYGDDEKTGVSHVSMAYAGARGVEDLAHAIVKSQPASALEEVDPLS